MDGLLNEACYARGKKENYIRNFGSLAWGAKIRLGFEFWSATITPIHYAGSLPTECEDIKPATWRANTLLNALAWKDPNEFWVLKHTSK
jgi:hypothetical protein